VTASDLVVLASNGSSTLSLLFSGPVVLMLAAVAVLTVRERRRSRATKDSP
jgi:cytochrome c-type biogenesis protein CcmH/NrfF